MPGCIAVRRLVHTVNIGFRRCFESAPWRDCWPFSSCRLIPPSIHLGCSHLPPGYRWLIPPYKSCVMAPHKTGQVAPPDRNSNILTISAPQRKEEQSDKSAAGLHLSNTLCIIGFTVISCIMMFFGKTASSLTARAAVLWSTPRFFFFSLSEGDIQLISPLSILLCGHYSHQTASSIRRRGGGVDGGGIKLTL